MSYSRDADIVCLSEIKLRKMIAQYVLFYGNTNDNTRKKAKPAN